MIFIVILIALLIERFFDWSHVRQWGWLAWYQQKLSIKIMRLPMAGRMLVCVAPLLIVVGLVWVMLTGWVYGLLKLVFSVLVLIYCLGPRNFWADAYKAMQGDYATATKQVEAAFDISPPASVQAYHQAFTRQLFVSANQRVYAVLFWFVLLGPIGAVLYRVLVCLKTPSVLKLNSMATQMVEWLNWLPARIMSFIFALGGHFTEVLKCFKSNALRGVAANDTLLADCGIAGLDLVKNSQLPEDGSAEKAAISLLDRTFVISLIALAVIVIII